MKVTIEELWNHGDAVAWDKALSNYWTAIKPQNMAVEEEMDQLDPGKVSAMDIDTFYRWLHDRYFVWKYTAANRLASTRKKLKNYEGDKTARTELDRIHTALFNFDKQQPLSGLEIAMQIQGLGVAGASGLLAVLFPQYFGTVDQFVVQELKRLRQYQSSAGLPANPRKDGTYAINITHAVYIIEEFRRKATELNTKFATDRWTPRKIDMVLWSIRS